MSRRFGMILLLFLSSAFAGSYLHAQPLQEHSQKLHPVKKNNRWGFIDNQGKLVVPCQYKSLTYDHFVNGYIAVQDTTNHPVLLNENGKEAMRETGCLGMCTYGFFSAGRVPFNTMVKFGKMSVYYKDLNGKIYRTEKANQALFSNYVYFSEGLCMALGDSGVGYVNTEAKLVIPAEYEWGTPFRYGRAIVRVNGKFGILDTRGSWVVKPEFQNIIYSSADGTYYGNNGKNWTRFNADGKQAEVYDDGLQLYAEQPVLGKDEFLVYQRNGRFGFASTAGMIMTKDTFQGVGYFSGGLAAIQTKGEIKKDPQGTPYLDGGWGYISTKGQIVVDAVLDEVTPFVNGTAAVKYKGFWGIIDSAGNWLVQPSYLIKPQPFRGDLAQVSIPDPNCRNPNCKDILIGYVNRKGVVVWKPQR